MLVSPPDCLQIKPLRLLSTVSSPSAAFIHLRKPPPVAFTNFRSAWDFQVAYGADVS